MLTTFTLDIGEEISGQICVDPDLTALKENGHVICSAITDYIILLGRYIPLRTWLKGPKICKYL